MMERQSSGKKKAKPWRVESGEMRAGAHGTVRAFNKVQQLTFQSSESVMKTCFILCMSSNLWQCSHD